MTWFERFSIAVTRHLHPIFIRDTERIGLSSAFVVIGINSLIALREQGAFEGIPLWAYIEWSLTLILGGLFTIWGMFRSMRLLERVGISLAAIGTFTYGIALISINRERAIILGIFFLFLTVVKLTRLMVSTAANAATNGGSRS